MSYYDDWVEPYGNLKTRWEGGVPMYRVREPRIHLIEGTSTKCKCEENHGITLSSSRKTTDKPKVTCKGCLA